MEVEPDMEMLPESASSAASAVVVSASVVVSPAVVVSVSVVVSAVVAAVVSVSWLPHHVMALIASRAAPVSAINFLIFIIFFLLMDSFFVFSFLCTIRFYHFPGE